MKGRVMESGDYKKEDYLELVKENQYLQEQVKLLTIQARTIKREMLQERLWRIEFQVNFLKQLAETSKEELERLNRESQGTEENA